MPRRRRYRKFLPQKLFPHVFHHLASDRRASWMSGVVGRSVWRSPETRATLPLPHHFFRCLNLLPHSFSFLPSFLPLLSPPPPTHSGHMIHQHGWRPSNVPSGRRRFPLPPPTSGESSAPAQPTGGRVAHARAAGRGAGAVVPRHGLHQWTPTRGPATPPAPKCQWRWFRNGSGAAAGLWIVLGPFAERFAGGRVVPLMWAARGDFGDPDDAGRGGRGSGESGLCVCGVQAAGGGAVGDEGVGSVGDSAGSEDWCEEKCGQLSLVYGRIAAGQNEGGVWGGDSEQSGVWADDAPGDYVPRRAGPPEESRWVNWAMINCEIFSIFSKNPISKKNKIFFQNCF